MMTSTSVAKSIATAGASASLLGMGGWAWATAIVGSFFALYLEGAMEPKHAFKAIIELLGWAFVAALVAIALPAVPWLGIGDFARAIPVEIRAGILGLSIRWAVTNGKSALSAKAKNWGEK